MHACTVLILELLLYGFLVFTATCMHRLQCCMQSWSVDQYSTWSDSTYVQENSAFFQMAGSSFMCNHVDACTACARGNITMQHNTATTIEIMCKNNNNEQYKQTHYHKQQSVCHVNEMLVDSPVAASGGRSRKGGAVDRMEAL